MVCTDCNGTGDGVDGIRCSRCDGTGELCDRCGESPEACCCGDEDEDAEAEQYAARVWAGMSDREREDAIRRAM